MAPFKFQSAATQPSLLTIALCGMQSTGIPFKSQNTMAIILSANGGVIISWEWMNYNVSIAWTLFCFRIPVTGLHFMIRTDS